MWKKLKIIRVDLFEDYLLQVDENLASAFESLEEADISTDGFSFYTSVSSVFSSKIEGEEIELDSYIKHKKFGIDFFTRLHQKDRRLIQRLHFC